MPSARQFGDIPGVPLGALVANCAAAATAGVHRPRIAGITGGAEESADSIVLNGGYEDDQDRGDEVIYTGHGGNDPEPGRQIADPTLTTRNKALAKNCLDGLPVRVIRGWREPSGFGPPVGFRYDGRSMHDARRWALPSIQPSAARRASRVDAVGVLTVAVTLSSSWWRRPE